MIKYPRTSSGNSSGFFDDDEPMHPYQTPPQSPASSPTSSALGSQCLQRHIVRMFSSEDASGTSAVAIDNKIEQAMDLVKSHLMIAVREEVEVLKEKISELMDKINQLEVENTILKANMSQETLQQLQMQTQLQIAGSTPTNGSNMLAAAPTPAAITAAPPVVASQQQTASATVNANANNSNTATAAATPQSNVGSGTATPTTQQPIQQQQQTTVAASQEQNNETTNVANVDDNQQATVQATNGPMS